MNKERVMRQVLGALAIVVLVLVTNEGYRHVRGLVDSVNQSKTDIAQLKRDVYVLQVQLDNQPVAGRSTANLSTTSVPLPMPFPMMPAQVGQLDTIAETPKKQNAVAPKSLMNVELMSDEKSPPGPTSSRVEAKAKNEPKISVQLIGDAK